MLTPPQHKIKREQYGILFNVADRRRAGKLNIADWASFENLLAKPDAEYEIAFRLFDFDGTLVDTTEMIFQSMRHATSSVLGRDDFSREELLANVGQPLPRQMEVFDAEKAELLSPCTAVFSPKL